MGACRAVAASLVSGFHGSPGGTKLLRYGIAPLRLKPSYWVKINVSAARAKVNEVAMAAEQTRQTVSSTEIDQDHHDV